MDEGKVDYTCKKVSERLMVKYSDLIICDSINIDKHIHGCYDKKHVKTDILKSTCIVYGVDVKGSVLADDDKRYVNWMNEKGLGSRYYITQQQGVVLDV